MKVLISCGEASGDLYAGALAGELRVRDPGITIAGLGGPQLQAAGATLLGDYSTFAVTGLTGALRVVPKSIALLRRLTAYARDERPDVLVVIDAPDFNFPLMRRAGKLGIPVVYYVSPQLWAWRRGRMSSMQRWVSQVLVIFPFEEPLYREAGVPVEFVGHPLVDLAAATQERAELLAACGLSASAPTVALLPGSRRNELHRIAPVMAESLPLIRARVPDVQFVVAAAPGLPDEAFAGLVGPPQGGPSTSFRRPVLIRERTNDVLNACDLAITASGTATVQCALHERPMVVVYRISALDYQMAKRVVTVEHIAMPNVLAGRRIVPELVQHELTPDRVADAAITLLTNAEARTATVNALRDVRRQLGTTGASARAAAAVLDVARGRGVSSRDAHAQ